MSDEPPIGSVDKALRVLEALAAVGPHGSPLAEIAQRTGLSKPTAHRTLAALRFRGFAVQHEPTGHYVLGASAIRLADDYLTEEHLPEMLHQALIAVCADTDELVHLGVLNGNEVVYLDKVEPQRAVRVWSAVGRHAPAAATALGRAVLAYQHPHRSSMPWYVNALPAEKPMSDDALWHSLQETLRRGYSTEQQENEPGISCLGFPLLRGATPIAAISITAPAERLDAARIRDLVVHLPQLLSALLPEGIRLPQELRTA